MSASEHLNPQQFKGTWDDVVQRHPDMAQHEDAVNTLAHGAHVHDEDATMSHSAHELTYSEREVPLNRIRNNTSQYRDPDFSRVQDAQNGYHEHEDAMPPLLLVRRAGGYEVADGHHRAQAKKGLMFHTHVNAVVAKSPRKDRLRPPPED